MEAEAEAYLDEIEKRGGVLKCIEDGYQQREIAKAAYRYQKEIESQDRIIVGINRYVMDDEEIEIPILYIDESVEREQVAFVKKIRGERDNDKTRRTLEDLTECARGNGNTLKAILDCVRVYATEGEICDALRPVFGEYIEPPFI
jgi:methylmalonyl-CoA mutase N-terminal domain/subunit